MTRQEALRRISSALRAAGHERDKKEYVLWPPRERWPGPHSPFCRHVDAACDELGLYPTPRAVLQERDCRPCNWVVEVYVSERISPPGWREPEWELCNNVEVDIDANEWTQTGMRGWEPIP